MEKVKVKVEAYKANNGNVYFTEAEAIKDDKDTEMYKSISSLPRAYTNDELCADFVYDNAEELYKILKVRFEGKKPAINRTDGTQFWYQKGQLYRDDDKIIRIWTNGTKFWFKKWFIKRSK